MYVLSQTGRSLSHVKRFLRGHRSARRAACLHCNLSYTDSKPNERTERVPGSKRTAALHIGYIGTDFKGLQASRSLPVDDTIECVLERALLNAGFIAPYNYGDLFKVKWSRSSRTDKGVHSLCTVVACRILLSDGDAGYEQDPEGLQMAALINSHLPDSIRVFSVQRVQKKFHARHWCQDRTYEYYLPLHVLHVLQDQRSEVQHAAPTEGHATATELALQNFRVALSTFVGTHAFHNYTTRKGISSIATTQQPPAASLSAVGPEPSVPLASTLIPASSSSPSMSHPPVLCTALRPNDLSVASVVDISAADDQGGKSCKVQDEPSSSHFFDAYAPVNPEAQCMKPSGHSMAATAASRSSSRDGGNLVLSDDSSDDVVMEDVTAEYGDWQHLDSWSYHKSSSRDDYNDPADVRTLSSSAAEDDDRTSSGSSLASALSCIVREYRGKKQRAWVRSCTWQSGSLPKGDVDRVSPQHYRSIYSWTVSCPTSLVPGGIPCVKLVVHGSSFLLHQIRHMIGAAVAVSKGIMSQQLLEASLNEHCRIQIPRAPPHTLLLSDASFRPFRKETQAASINNKTLTLSASNPNLSTTFRAEDSCILSESGSSLAAEEPCNHQPDPHNHDNRSLRLMSAPFRFTGDVLELRSGGTTNREDFRQQVFDSALNASLSHPDWATFSENIEILKWLEEDVHVVEQEFYTWRDRKRTLHEKQNEL
ncbi:hypothetical protein CEUSTIGMA_g7716.t1 [Chlamydomonas eustigma]|uniref:Pseudouridine synthase I TruA alpha/beta domain-containing protein n=1 Tax=Chlamydomonas eustigma TaxID=1157962 RepID=A0A250XB13_9CHLO|nr:hypothetical protein CEUSTIGMA_g7716.t1 [Chlamydomonas eustigma]|eukprot:GAX80278.1 hypothetical protein CEUSTIGMA_g7716.t1 [Chlamydomonas eustigma]